MTFWWPAADCGQLWSVISDSYGRIGQTALHPYIAESVKQRAGNQGISFDAENFIVF